MRSDDLGVSRLKPADKQQLVCAWPPYFSGWNLDYADGSYVTAIVSAVCCSEAVREMSVPPRNIRTVLCCLICTRSSCGRLGPHYISEALWALWSVLMVRAVEGWRSIVSLSLVYFLLLSWNVFPRGICWKQNCRSGCKDKALKFTSEHPNHTSDDFWGTNF